MAKKNSQKKEIFYNIINSLLAGSLVLFGACSTGNPITWSSLGLAFAAASVTAISQFKKYWESQAGEYSSTKLLSFIAY